MNFDDVAWELFDMNEVSSQEAWDWLTESEQACCKDDDDAWWFLAMKVKRAKTRAAAILRCLVLAQMCIPEWMLEDYLEPDEMHALGLKGRSLDDY